MRTIHRSRTIFSAVAAVLVFALAAPIAVNADDEVIAAEEQVLAAAPAAPSWDETSGYGSVEASRAAVSELLAAGAAPSWDVTSGYGSVEASRADLSALLSGGVISGQAEALALAAAAAESWDETSGYGSVEASRAAASARLTPIAAPSTCADYIPSALASGRRAESMHLATVPLPGEDAVDGGVAGC
jgi:hypothetical protein